MNVRSNLIAPLLAALLLAACGSRMSGTYGTQAQNDIQFVFSGDRVTLKKYGDNVAVKYKVEGKTLSLVNPNGQGYSFKLDDNGCIYDGGILIGGKACKQ